MQISKEQLADLTKFKEALMTYQGYANDVFGVINGHDYMSDSEFKKLRNNEKTLRDDLNGMYGGLEDLIEELNGSRLIAGGGWGVFEQALSGDFNIIKGHSLSMAVDATVRLLGKAKKLVSDDASPTPSTTTRRWFSEDLLVRVKDQKIKKLCEELERVLPDNPNAGALLMRTILLITLQKKIGKGAKNDLKPVLDQAILQDVYGDVHIKRILGNLSSIPKTMLDATHHSKWVLIKNDDLGLWLSGLVSVIEATYPVVDND